MPRTKMKAFVPVGRVKRGRPGSKSNGTPFKKKKQSYVDSRINTRARGKSELHFNDLATGPTVISATGNIINAGLELIRIGTDEIDRIGSNITLKSIAVRMQMRLPVVNSAEGQDDVIRVMLVVNHQTNGVQATVAQVLESADHLSFNNLALQDRFTVLMDKYYPLSHTAGGPNSATTTKWCGFSVMDTYFKKLNMSVDYNADTGAIGDLQGASLFFLVVSVIALGTFEAEIRLRFTP